jgi:heparin/heparan-sulfate lyase
MDKGSANDGGQYWPNNGRDHPRDLETLLDTANGYKMGEVRARAFGPDFKTPDYSYISGDITPAYAAQKVSRVERSMVCFSRKGTSNPAVLVVYDQVTSTNASFKKRWLLHSIQQPIISGRTITILRNEAHYSGDGNYSGKLVVQSLLPQDASITRIGGPGYEFWVQSVSTNYATTKGNGAEPGAWRVEVLPNRDSLHTEFLHVLCAMDISTSPSSVEQIASGSFIGAKTPDRAVLFNREQDVPDTVDISISGTDSLGILVTGLRPGTWKVNRNGSSVGEYTATDSGGCIYFKSMAGQMQLIWSDSVNVETGPNLCTRVWIHAVPNPFSRATRLQFNVPPISASVRLDIYNLQGRKIKTILVSGNAGQGPLNSTAVWDGRDDQGRGAAPSIYIVKINRRKTFAVLKLLKMD